MFICLIVLQPFYGEADYFVDKSATEPKYCNVQYFGEPT